ncbi:hypothetical protein ACFV4P_23935 [Kitasatospora sp. NPDC059795]|uniref:hypothetical protein n=1 Tax=Kitasatospora sp. NPDC059795 TaxID=3346949 RepID=UPI003652D088
MQEATRSREHRAGGEVGANGVTVDGELFDRYVAQFEEPRGEGEQVVVQSSR